MSILERVDSRREFFQKSLIAGASLILGCSPKDENSPGSQKQEFTVAEVRLNVLVDLNVSGLQSEPVGISKLILYSAPIDSSVWFALIFEREISPVEGWDVKLSRYKPDFNLQDRTPAAERLGLLEDQASLQTFYHLLSSKYPDEIVRTTFFGAFKKPNADYDYIVVYKNNSREGYLKVRVDLQ